MSRIEFVRSNNLGGEAAKLFDSRLQDGFWDKFVRTGTVVDIGYKGGNNYTPIFRDAIGLDTDTPGYNKKDLPYKDETIGTIHASHVLEHIADYKHFFQDCFRVLVPHGTLILFVPLQQAYERREKPPSRHNWDHKRFYTCASLLTEIETLPRHIYRVIHLAERFRTSDFCLDVNTHAVGPSYEIECVLEKIIPDGIYC